MRPFKKKSIVEESAMDEQEKKIQRVTHDDCRSQTDHIPLDITSEILSRLPAKSIVRFSCVSKLWYSFITLPSFINSFASRSSTRRFMVTFFLKGRQFVFSFPQNQYPDGSYSPVYSYHITHPWVFPLSESIQGLILLSGLKIWNPTLRKVLALPHPNEHVPSRDFMSYLGYDPLEGKHKVLCLSINGKSVQSFVLTLGDQESWRIITKNTPMHHPNQHHPNQESGLCFNGVLYYEARVDGHNIIMSFDVKSESFSPIKYPEGLSRLLFHMIPYEGKLALLTSIYRLQDVDLYILKDADGHEWTHQRFLHIPCKVEWRNRMGFKGITDAGEFIFVPYCFSPEFYILYFDPRRNSTREALFEGLMGGEFRRHYGLSSTSIYTQDFFPNHTESLVSL